MKIPRPLVRGRLIKRYKRFLADVELEDGTTITAHTANPGSMLGLKAPGSEVLLTHHPHGKRKLPYSAARSCASTTARVGTDPSGAQRVDRGADGLSSVGHPISRLGAQPSK